jgi:beta-lactamase class A
VIGFSVGAATIWNVFAADEAANDRDVRENQDGSFHFTNPLLECDNGQEIFQKLYPRINKGKIEGLIEEAKNRGDITFASFYFRDLRIGGTVGINEDELFAPASLLKVPLMMFWLKQSERDPNALTQNVRFTDDLHGTERQYFKSTDPVQKEVTYTVADLLRHLIIHSDNDAADALAQLATKPALEKLFQDMKVEFPQDNGDRMSISEYARFFRILFNASYLSRDNSEAALQLMSQNTFHKGMTAKLPSDVIVANKFGERSMANLAIDQSTDRQLHECGIVYATGRPYLLCVMTRGDDMDRLASVIADVSKMVYDQVMAAN